MGQLVNVENYAGQTIRLGEAKVIPVEKSVRLQPPGMWGFLSWRRPSLVLVEHPDGSEQIIKVQDPTRQAQIVLLIIGIVGSLAIWLFNQRFNVERSNV
jgi:hypothetical protein